MKDHLPSLQTVQDVQNAAARQLAVQQSMRARAFSLSRAPQSWDEYLWQRERYERQLEKLEASKQPASTSEKVALGILVVASLFLFPLLIVSMGFLVAYSIRRGQAIETDKKIDALERKLDRPAPSYLEPLSPAPLLNQSTPSPVQSIPVPKPTAPLDTRPSAKPATQPVLSIPPSPIPPSPIPTAPIQPSPKATGPHIKTSKETPSPAPRVSYSNVGSSSKPPSTMRQPTMRQPTMHRSAPTISETSIDAPRPDHTSDTSPFTPQQPDSTQYSDFHIPISNMVENPIYESADTPHSESPTQSSDSNSRRNPNDPLPTVPNSIGNAQYDHLFSSAKPQYNMYDEIYSVPQKGSLNSSITVINPIYESGNGFPSVPNPSNAIYAEPQLSLEPSSDNENAYDQIITRKLKQPEYILTNEQPSNAEALYAVPKSQGNQEEPYLEVLPHSTYESPVTKHALPDIKDNEEKFSSMLDISYREYTTYPHLSRILLECESQIPSGELPDEMRKDRIAEEMLIRTDQRYYQKEMEAYYTENQTPGAKFVHGLSKAADWGANIFLLNFVHHKIPKTPRYDFSRNLRKKIHAARTLDNVENIAVTPVTKERLEAQRIIEEASPAVKIGGLRSAPQAHTLYYNSEGKLDSPQDINNNGINVLFQKAYDQVRDNKIPDSIAKLTKDDSHKSAIKDIYLMAQSLHNCISGKSTLSLDTMYNSLNKSGTITENAIFDIMSTSGVIYRNELLTAQKQKSKSRQSSRSSLVSYHSITSTTLPEEFEEFLEIKDEEIKTKFREHIPRKFKANLQAASQMLADTLASPDEKIAKGHVATTFQNAERTGVLDRVVHSALQYGHVSNTKETQQDELSVAASLVMGGRLFYSFNHEHERLQFMEHLYGGNFTDAGGRIYALPTIKQVNGKDYVQKTFLNDEKESITILEAITKTDTEPYYILGENNKLYNLKVNAGYSSIERIVKNISITEKAPENTSPYAVTDSKYGSITLSDATHTQTNQVRIDETNYRLEEHLNTNNDRIFTLTSTAEPKTAYLLGSHGTLYTLPEGYSIDQISTKKEAYLHKGEALKVADIQLPEQNKQKILNPKNASATVSDRDLVEKKRFAFRRPTSTHSVDQEAGIEVKSFWKGVKKVLFRQDQNDIGMNLPLGGIGKQSKHATYYKNDIIKARQIFLKDAKKLGLSEKDIIKNEKLEVLPDGVHGHLLVYSCGNYMLIGIEKSEYGKGEHDLLGRFGEKSAFLIDGKINGCKDPEIVTWMQVPPATFGDIRVNMSKARIDAEREAAKQFHGRPLSKGGVNPAKDIQRQVQQPLGQKITDKGNELQEDSKRKYQHFDIHISYESKKCLESMAGLSPKQQKYYKEVMADITKEYKDALANHKQDPIGRSMAEGMLSQQFLYLEGIISTDTKSKKTPAPINMKSQRNNFQEESAWEKYREVAEYLEHKVSKETFKEDIQEKARATDLQTVYKNCHLMHHNMQKVIDQKNRLKWVEQNQGLSPEKKSEISTKSEEIITNLKQSLSDDLTALSPHLKSTVLPSPAPVLVNSLTPSSRLTGPESSTTLPSFNSDTTSSRSGSFTERVSKKTPRDPGYMTL